METPEKLAASLIGPLVLLGAPAASAGAATALSRQANDAYVKQLKPGVGAYARAVKAIGREVDKAPKQSDAQVAAKFTSLTKRVSASAKQIEAVQAPSVFRARQKAVSLAIRRVARDTKQVVGAAQTHNTKRAKELGFALGRHLKQSARALKALDKALNAQKAANAG